MPEPVSQPLPPVANPVYGLPRKLWKRTLALAVSAVCLSLPAFAGDQCPEAFGSSEPLQPGAVIMGDHFPGDMMEVHYAVLQGANGTQHLLRGRVENGKPAFTLSYAPDAPWTGGPATIRLTDGLSICQAVFVTIAPMQRADGAFDVLVASLKENLSQKAERFDLDFETLADPAFATDDPKIDLLHQFALMIDGADTPESIQAQIDDVKSDTDPAVTEAFHIFEAMLNTSGSLDAIAEEIRTSAAIRTPSGPQTSPPATPKPQPARFDTSGSRPDITFIQLDGNKPKKPVPKIDVKAFDTAKELSDAMIEQLDSESGNKPHVQIYRDAAGAMLGAGSALGKAAGPGGARLAQVYDASSQALFLWGLLDKLQEGLYPNELVDMKIDAAPTTLFVDESPEEGMVAAVWVTPRAKGIDLGKLAFDVAFQFLPVTDLVHIRQGSARNLSRSFSYKAEADEIRRSIARHRNARPPSNAPVPRPLDRRTGDRLMELEQSGGSQVARANAQRLVDRMTRHQFRDGMLMIPTDMTKPLILGNIINALPDMSVVPPFDYPRVNILEKGYLNLNLSRAGVIDMTFSDSGSVFYKSIEAGRVMINALTAPGKFGNSQAKAEQEITVRNEWGIALEPGLSVISPGQSVRLNVIWNGPDDMVLQHFNVNYDTDQKVHDFRLSKAPVELPDGRLAYTLDIKTVADGTRFPVNVTTSLRTKPEISARAVIRAAQITPTPICLDADSETQFSVALSGKETMKDLIWTVTQGPGKISRDGVYTAPSDASRNTAVTIEARPSTGNGPAMTVETKLNCGCSWTLQAMGKTYSGTDVVVMDQGGGSEGGHLIVVNDSELASATLASPNSVAVGARAAALISTVGMTALGTECDGDENNDGICDERDPPPEITRPNPISYYISTISKDYVEGQASGMAVVMNELPSGDRYVTKPVSFRFRAARSNPDAPEDPTVAMARKMAGAAGTLDSETLAYLNQISGLMGGATCNRDAD